MRNVVLTIVIVLAGFAVAADTVRALTGSVNKVSNTLKVK